MGDGFPLIERGGSLLVAWQVRNKKVLVVGGGEVRNISVHTHLEAHTL